MKTVHLINAWQSRGGGGISTFYRALLKQARESGGEMVIVAPGESDECTVDGSTRVYTVKAPVSPFNAKYRMIFPDTWPVVSRRVHEILRHEQPDLLDVCDKYSLHYVAGLLRRGWLSGVRRPVLIATSCERMDENMAYYLSGSPLGRRFCRWYLKWNYFGYFDHHITVSAHTAEELHEAARGHVRRRGVWVKSMGVDCARFSRALRRPEARLNLLRRADANTLSRVVVYSGRLVPEKNLPLLLDTFEELTRSSVWDCRLVIAGDGMLRDALEAECGRRFHGAVTFLGHLGAEELAVLLANSDVFLHPNPREPYGIAPLEAMASGLPLVCCDSGGVLSYANGTNAWLSPAVASAMALAVESVFADAPLRELRLGAALETAGSLDWTIVAAGFRKLYEDFVAGAAAGAAFETTPGDWLGVEATVGPPERST